MRLDLGGFLAGGRFGAGGSWLGSRQCAPSVQHARIGLVPQSCRAELDVRGSQSPGQENPSTRCGGASHQKGGWAREGRTRSQHRRPSRGTSDHRCCSRESRSSSRAWVRPSERASELYHRRREIEHLVRSGLRVRRHPNLALCSDAGVSRHGSGTGSDRSRT